VAFWEALPYMWVWDPPKPGARTFGGHWEVRATGEPATDATVQAHLRGMGVTVVG
jgi:hypothetical protein